MKWDVLANTEEFDVLVLDRNYFYQYIRGLPFGCLNDCISDEPSSHKRGNQLALGSGEYYVIVVDRSRSGTSKYTIEASVNPHR